MSRATVDWSDALQRIRRKQPVFVLVSSHLWHPTQEEWEAALGSVSDATVVERIRRYHRGYASPKQCRHWEMADTKAFVLARLMLQTALDAGLSVYDNCTPAHNRYLKYTDEGRPHVGSSGTWLNANVSHAGGCAGIAVMDCPGLVVGCDVMPVELAPPQPLDPDSVSGFFQDFVDFFTREEWLWIRWSPDPSDAPEPCFAQLKRFITLWTLKEALIKAIGIGLGFDLQTASFRLDRHDILADDFYSGATRVAVELAGRVAPEWHFELQELRDSNLVGAVAIAPVSVATQSSFGKSFALAEAAEASPKNVSSDVSLTHFVVSPTSVLKVSLVSHGASASTVE